MSIRLVVPNSVRGGFYRTSRNWAVGIWAHTLQCDQRWIFLVRIGRHAFAYRTRGDATPQHSTYYCAGWYWPWNTRFGSGRR